MHEEKWAPIPDWPYEASTHGNIRIAKAKRMLRCATNHAGYRCVKLCFQQKCFQQKVHRLVASAFLKDWDPKLTVDHINRVRDDNRLENLRMATPRQQQYNVDRKNHAKGAKRAIQQLDMDGFVVQTHDSLTDAAQSVGCKCKSNLSKCAYGRSNTAYGFKWAWVQSPDMPGEEWRQDPEDPTIYVSNKCRFKQLAKQGVFRIRRYKELCKVSGYGVYKNKVRQQLFHRTVARLFVPNPDPEKKTIVNHIDGNKDNPLPDNLEWCTHSENTKHAHKIGLIWGAGKAVDQYDTRGNHLATYASQTKAAEAMRLSSHRISACATGRSETAGGYVWVFADQSFKLRKTDTGSS